MSSKTVIVAIAVVTALALITWWTTKDNATTVKNDPHSSSSMQSGRPLFTSSTQDIVQPTPRNANDQSGRPGVKSRDFSESIPGIDANANGVRDDIEDYINRTYPDPTRRTAMLFKAKGVIGLMTVDTTDLDKVTEVATFHARAAECLANVFGSEKWTIPSAEITAMHMNTESRFRAYTHFMTVGGYIIEGLRQGEDACSWVQN